MASFTNRMHTFARFFKKTLYASRLQLSDPAADHRGLLRAATPLDRVTLSSTGQIYRVKYMFNSITAVVMN